MANRKTTITIEDYNNDILEKFWIVGEPRKVLNYIANDVYQTEPNERNEMCIGHCYGFPPKHFKTFAEARACAKFWNEKVPWKFDQTQKVARHGMLCVFKPHLVKVSFV